MLLTFLSCQFLSTLSLRRATIIPVGMGVTASFLSTLSLRRATLAMGLSTKSISNFYPRSPCGERLFLRSGPMTRRYFYPRSPCGERRAAPTFTDQRLNFYPRSPCGERQLILPSRFTTLAFLSTLSLRRATMKLML